MYYLIVFDYLIISNLYYLIAKDIILTEYNDDFIERNHGMFYLEKNNNISYIFLYSYSQTNARHHRICMEETAAGS